MAFCGPNHHGGTASTQLQLAAPADHAHQLGGTSTTHDHRGQADQVDEDSPDLASSAAFAKVSDPGTQMCSACASCCSTGAILNSVLAVPALIFTPTVFSTVAPGVDTFAADGPDRPPRIVLV